MARKTLNTNDIVEIKKIAKISYRHFKKIRSIRTKIAELNSEMESEENIIKALSSVIQNQFGYGVFDIVMLEDIDGTPFKEPQLRYPETILPPQEETVVCPEDVNSCGECPKQHSGECTLSYKQN